MSEENSNTRRTIALGLGAAAASSLIPQAAWAQSDRDTYSEPEIVRAAEDFFGAAAEGLANVIHHIFNEKGRPNGYITGDEGSGAIGVGLRYGGGRLHLKGRSGVTPVYWQGPSIGFDTGGNASKVFTLVYHMRDPSRIFQRFPGVDGSAYFVGGFGMTAAVADEMVVVPIRSGVGARLGINMGYLKFTGEPTWNPF